MNRREELKRLIRTHEWWVQSLQEDLQFADHGAYSQDKARIRAHVNQLQKLRAELETVGPDEEPHDPYSGR